jgi:hypothetical protein
MDAMPASFAKPIAPCQADRCDHPAYARGLCSAHYQRKIQDRENDRPIVRKGTPLTERVPIWLAECTNVNGCLIYPRVNKIGYPTHVHDDNGKPISRYRAVYMTVKGAVPKWAQIHHACGVNTCINPDHLILASQAENVAEMHARQEYERRIAHLEAELAAHHCQGCHCPH